MPSDSVSNESNLARIRDNQRRSRARRKEYLNELEEKWRACEQSGVEASAELQVAARRVLEENKRLRSLLRIKGVADHEVDDFVADDASQFDVLPPSLMLSSALTTRRSCGPGGCDSPVSDASVPRRLSATPAVLQSSNSMGQQQGAHLQRLAIPSSGFGSTAPGVSSPMRNYSPTGSNLRAFSQAGPQSSMTSPAHPNMNYAAPQNGPYYTTADQATWQTWPMADTGGASAMDHSYNSGSTDCNDAAQIIRSMSTNQVGTELEDDLGCARPGSNCQVDNNQVFDVLDKYSGMSSMGWG